LKEVFFSGYPRPLPPYFNTWSPRSTRSGTTSINYTLRKHAHLTSTSTSTSSYPTSISSEHQLSPSTNTSNLNQQQPNFSTTQAQRIPLSQHAFISSAKIPLLSPTHMAYTVIYWTGLSGNQSQSLILRQFQQSSSSLIVGFWALHSLWWSFSATIPNIF
jgi:hypothetical protein